MKKCAVDGYFNGAVCGNLVVGTGNVCGLDDMHSCTYQLTNKSPVISVSTPPPVPVATPAPVKVKKKPVLEKHVEAHLYKKMKKLGGECYKWTSQNNRGVPDRICVFPDGKVVFVELKRDIKCKLSKGQTKFFERMAALKVTNWHILHGKDEVNLWIKSLGYNV